MSADIPDVTPAAVTTPAPPPTAPTSRVAGWQVSDRLVCPEGHQITRRDSFLSGTLVCRCECGRGMLAIAAADLLTTVSPPARLVFTLEVTKAEVNWILRERPSLHQLLDRAGLLLGAAR